jgi:hypothetical protein
MSIDDITISKVSPQFNGNISKRRKDYERAKQDIPKLKEKVIVPLEKALKSIHKYGEYNLPVEPVTEEITRGLVTFKVKTGTKTKKPSYKSAVIEMEHYLQGILFHLSRGRAIKGIIKEGNAPYIPITEVRDDYDIIVAGILEPQIKHTVRYSAKGFLKNEKTLESLIIPSNRDPSAKTEENFMLYVRADRILKDEEEFLKEYEKELTKGLKGRKRLQTVQVSGKAAYETKRSKTDGPNYALVVKTLVTVPVSGAKTGELDILADDTISLQKKRKRFNYYELMEQLFRGKPKLYVSIPSLYERIQHLKQEYRTKSKRVVINPKEIIK